MADLKPPKDQSQDAEVLATSYEMVRYAGITYVPADCDTREWEVVPSKEKKIWLPLRNQDVQRRVHKQFNLLFRSESEMGNFSYMVAQCAIQQTEPVNKLLIRTAQGLRVLLEDGRLVEPDGSFVPNTLPVPLNEDRAAKDAMFETLVEWLGSEEEARSLLRHLATALAPGWSAVKYVLLMGDGRNGKSVLLSMIERMFGTDNCSTVTRQEISDRSPVVTELMGKLVNLVYDGVAEYLKDSGLEKSLIAGEPVGIRRLYSSELTTVQTNALFIEGLNKEPKSSDKSSALQARLVRFWFPNTYEDDLMFRDHMLSDQMVGALLSLMLDHFVKKEDKARALAPTSNALRLKLEHMHTNSLALQFLVFVDRETPLGADGLIGAEVSELAAAFQSWRVKENDLSVWSETDVAELFRPVLDTDRRSKRVHGKARKVRVVTGFKRDAEAFIKSLEGDDADVVVDD